jgi:nucleotide-binding universal stress UspA family protein
MSLMNNPKPRVVVGVDLSAAAESLVRWADREAKARAAVLFAVTALAPAESVLGEVNIAEAEAKAYRELTETVKAALPPDRASLVKLRVSTRDPALALVSHARRAELLVVGPHGHGGISGLLLGSVAEHVISRASCPVAVVHPRRHPETGRIVVGVDGSDCARQALEWAVQRAALYRSRVEAIAVWDWRAQYGMPPYGASEETQQRWAEDLLSQEIGKLAPSSASKVTHRVERGNAAAVLAAASAEADMIVVGNHGAGSAVSRLLGSVSQKVARHARVPVVVVHDHDHEHGRRASA